ncbi:MAG: MoaD/ThiS family protein [Actinomycetota bacterium]|nr:MoaD/ThiS family protein [Actinomycetota bacterium]
MTTITFAKAFRRHVDCPDETVQGATVADALGDYFTRHPAVRSYVLDDEGSFRRHITVFVDGDQVDHRRGPETAVGDTSVIHLFQALSGG